MEKAVLRAAVSAEAAPAVAAPRAVGKKEWSVESEKWS